MAERDNRGQLTEQVVRGKHLWVEDPHLWLAPNLTAYRFSQISLMI